MDEVEQRNAVGRPTDYDPDYCRQVQHLCQLGATDDEVADFLQVSTRTVYRWKLAHPEFSQALQNGKDISDERVERSLYQLATGAYYVEQQAIKVKTGQHTEEVKVVDVEKFRSPEVPAAIFGLKNRRPKAWRDRIDVDNTVRVKHEDGIEALA